VELAEHPRRSHYELFRGYEDPFFSLTTTVDVTALHAASRAAGGPSFFLASLFASQRAADAVPEFRQRLRENGIWEHARVDVGATVLRPDGTFAFAYFAWAEDAASFQDAGKREIDRVVTRTGPAEPRDDRDDLIHHSVLPWISFTSFKNARRGAGESVPKVVFGRHEGRAGRRAMPVSLEVHHALVDGLHAARYLDALQAELDGWS